MARLRCLLALSLLLTGCLNHFVYHPKKDPPGVTTWREQAVRGKLLLRLEWARPDRPAQAAAVVAYYPVADFEAWMDGPHGNRPGEAFIWRMIRRHFRRSLGAKDASCPRCSAAPPR